MSRSNPVTVHDLEAALEAIAPARRAESWDNVGLLVGAGDRAAGRIVLTIDLTERVLDEARAVGANAIVAYHPPIFAPLKRLTDRAPKERLVLACAQYGIAILSPHTALDAAPGGVNDWLADGVGPGRVTALTPADERPASEAVKVVTFVPADAADAVRRALSAAGAGRIGAYCECSFEITGTGTFHGDEGTKPAVGRAGALERVEEVRLEMVCGAREVAPAIAALRSAHPYEEPPIEVHPLGPRPDESIGAGRLVALDAPATTDDIVARLKPHLGVERLFVSDGPIEHAVVGLCAGAGGSMTADAVARGATLYLTGEMRHHDVLAAEAAGCVVVLAGHTNTERGYLPVLAERLRAALPGIEQVHVAESDGDPLEMV